MNETLSFADRVRGGIRGALAGDALGVPVEFSSRASCQADPVISMREYGTHRQPAGTWSDDSSLLLCALESLVHADFDTSDMGLRFVEWVRKGHWAAHGEVFDIGGATSVALSRIAQGTPAEEAGGTAERDNGNGSIMRILPVALRFSGRPIHALADAAERASALTHGHPRSRLACAFCCLFAARLLRGERPDGALSGTAAEFLTLYPDHPELPAFALLLDGRLATRRPDEIDSSGYVMDTLIASIWCLLTTSTWSACTLQAINLGGDTDTTGCVAGGLAGLHYGAPAIPDEWWHLCARRQDVDALIEQFLAIKYV